MRRALTSIIMILCCGVAIAQQHNNLQIDKLSETFNYIRNNYIEDIDLDPLVQKAIEASLHELDPHSSYIPREEMIAMLNSIDGEFSGIGVTVITLRDTLIVTHIEEDSPAERAGIKKNDRIIAIDTTSLVGTARDKATKLLRGRKGSTAALSIIRGGNRIRIDVKRNDIPTKSIGPAFKLNDTTAYICVESFLSKSTAREFTEATHSLGKIGAMIIDLRGNIGGLLSSAIQFTELFLDRGDMIVSTVGRKGNSTYLSSRNGEYRDIPIVLLIDEYTASASEIVAGALQDHDRAVIVGRRSFGKGLVQRVYKFKDDSGIKLTIARYLTPSGRVIQRPYQSGDNRSYINDRERFKHPDSIDYTKLSKHNTLKYRRSVYGGGGITPDRYISNDTHSDTLKRHVVNHSQEIIVELFDRVPIDDFLRSYPTLDDYHKGFHLDSIGIEQIMQLEKGDSTVINTQECIAIIEAQIADDIYQRGAYYYIYGRHRDRTLAEAYKIISDTTLLRTILTTK